MKTDSMIVNSNIDDLESTASIPSATSSSEPMQLLLDASKTVKNKTNIRNEKDTLVQKNRMYKTILSNSPDFSYVFDREHRFIYANDVLLQAWGKTLEEAVGKTCLELGYEPWHAEMHSREIEQVIATKAPIRGEVPFNATFGRRIYDYIFVPVLNSDNEVEAIVGTTRDVTERKLMEEKLEVLLESERFARLESERLGRLKDEFLTTLSHELRTPLNSVLGWTQLLRSKTPDCEMLERGLQVIDRNAKLQGQLISDLLDMSRIISGKMRLDVDELDMVSIVQAATESIKPAADAKKIRVTLEAESISQKILGDPARLQQVVWNLLSNAVKFTPVEGLIDITLQQQTAAVELKVTDSGKGIKKEFLPIVFDRFRQADSSSARVEGGLGIGLALVKQITELHGGTVSVSSEGEGKGAIFRIVIPVNQGQSGSDMEIKPARLVQTEAKKNHSGSPLKSIKVLVLEDDPDAGEIVTRILADAGAETVLTTSVDDAMTLLVNSVFDIIVSDISLPKKDGYEFACMLREKGIKTPAIALTAFARPEDESRTKKAGFQAHLSKPLEVFILIETVLRLVEKY